MASLAFLLQTQLKYEEAETLLKQALAGTCNLLGSNHPDTLRAIQNLALLLVSKENYQEAEVLFNEALTSHPHILATLNNFAAMLKEPVFREGPPRNPPYRQSLGHGYGNPGKKC